MAPYSSRLPISGQLHSLDPGGSEGGTKTPENLNVVLDFATQFKKEIVLKNILYKKKKKEKLDRNKTLVGAAPALKDLVGSFQRINSRRDRLRGKNKRRHHRY